MCDWNPLATEASCPIKATVWVAMHAIEPGSLMCCHDTCHLFHAYHGVYGNTWNNYNNICLQVTVIMVMPRVQPGDQEQFYYCKQNSNNFTKLATMQMVKHAIKILHDSGTCTRIVEIIGLVAFTLCVHDSVRGDANWCAFNRIHLWRWIGTESEPNLLFIHRITIKSRTVTPPRTATLSKFSRLGHHTRCIRRPICELRWPIMLGCTV